jgi:uncharacterized protein
MNPRSVDVFDLARQARSVEVQVPVEQMPRLASLLAGAAAPVRAELKGGIDDQGRDAARLCLQGTLPLICDRCGRPYEWSLDAEAGFFFVADEAQLRAEPIIAEGDEPLIGSGHFDWWELVEDQAILSLPISPRHPDCGPAAGASADGGPDGERSHPFSSLASLKKGGNVVK